MSGGNMSKGRNVLHPETQRSVMKKQSCATLYPTRGSGRVGSGPVRPEAKI